VSLFLSLSFVRVGFQSRGRSARTVTAVRGQRRDCQLVLMGHMTRCPSTRSKLNLHKRYFNVQTTFSISLNKCKAT